MPVLDVETENRVMEDIKETEDSFFPDIYARDYSIRIEAGVNRFCGFIDLETTHRLSVMYRVTFNLVFRVHLKYQYLFSNTFQVKQ